MNDTYDKNMLEVRKEIFVSLVRNLPSRPPNRNRPLKDLVNKFRNELEHCDDEMPCNLTHLGMRGPMTFSDFIYKVTWS